MKKFFNLLFLLMSFTINSYGQLTFNINEIYADKEFDCTIGGVLCKRGGNGAEGEELYSDIGNYSADSGYGFCKLIVVGYNPHCRDEYDAAGSSYVSNTQIIYKECAFMHSANKHIYLVKLSNGECVKVADFGKYKSVVSIEVNEYNKSISIFASNINGGTSQISFYTTNLNNLTPIEVKVDEISLNESAITIDEGTTLQLEATVYPENAENKKLQWTSSNEGVATVVDGLVSGVKAGMAIVSAKATDDSNIMAQCIVVVQEANGVASVKANKVIESFYTLDGKRVDTVNKGVYIIRFTDGTTRELINK